MADPADDAAAEAIALFAQRPVNRVVALPTDLEAALDRLCSQATNSPDKGESEQGGEFAAGSSDLDPLRELASDAPVIRLLYALLGRRGRPRLRPAP